MTTTETNKNKRMSIMSDKENNPKPAMSLRKKQRHSLLPTKQASQAAPQFAFGSRIAQSNSSSARIPTKRPTANTTTKQSSRIPHYEQRTNAQRSTQKLDELNKTNKMLLEEKKALNAKVYEMEEQMQKLRRENEELEEKVDRLESFIELKRINAVELDGRKPLNFAQFEKEAKEKTPQVEEILELQNLFLEQTRVMKQLLEQSQE